MAGSNSVYNWSVQDNGSNRSNGVSGKVDIGGGTHPYNNDGYSPVVDVPGHSAAWLATSAMRLSWVFSAR